MNVSLTRAALLTLSVLALPLARAQSVSAADAAAGRALAKRYADAVVSVELVNTIKVSVGDRAIPPRDNKVDVNGTVISPSGLTVTSLSGVDPKAALEGMLNQRAPGQKIEIGETEFKEVKLRLANGTEIPAVIVLKDPDLDLVFIAPLPEKTGPARTFTYVPLDTSATAQVLDNFFVVFRAAKALQRVPMVRVAALSGVVEKPRTLYLLTVEVAGVAVFDAKGNVLGLATHNMENGRPAGLVVLSTGDVAELAKQAAAIKPEEKEETEAPSDSPAPQEAAPGAAATPAPAPAPTKTPPPAATPAK